MDDQQIAAVQALARIARLLERASGELSLAHFRVLSAIAAGDERASRVAVRLALGKPTISSAIDSLHQRGLIERADVIGDQRASALSVTAAGQALLSSVQTAMGVEVADLVNRTADPAGTYRALASLTAALDEAAEERFAATRATRS